MPDSAKSQSTTIPALADNAFLRYFTFSILYFAQGIPSGIKYYAFPAWMAMNGKSPQEIGSFIAIVMIPWSFKVIAAPIMDRFNYLPMGKRKPWVIFGQLGIAVTFFLYSLLSNPLEQMNWMIFIGFINSVFGIIQDISIDSMAIDILPENEQARANGLMWGSKIFGKAATLAVATWLFGKIGYNQSIILFSLVVLIIMLVPLLLKERACEKRFPWSKGKIAPETLHFQLHSWKIMFKSLFRVFFLPVSLVVAVISFVQTLGEGFIEAILPVFTVQELGWSDTTYSQIYSSSSMISGLLAIFVGGALIDFLGKKRMLTIYTLILIVLTVCMVLLKNHWNQTWLVTTFFITFNIFDIFSVVAIFAICMNVSWKLVAATQFTMYMAISNIGTSVGAWLMGALKTHFSWDMVILAYIPINVIVLGSIWFINFEKHKKQVDKLDEVFDA